MKLGKRLRKIVQQREVREKAGPTRHSSGRATAGPLAGFAIVGGAVARRLVGTLGT